MLPAVCNFLLGDAKSSALRDASDRASARHGTAPFAIEDDLDALVTMAAQGSRLGILNLVEKPRKRDLILVVPTKTQLERPRPIFPATQRGAGPRARPSLLW